MSNFPVKDEEIKALRLKVLKALAAAQYPAQAIGSVAGNNGLTVADVRSLVDGYGYPDPREMSRFAFELEGKTPPPAPQPDRKEVLRQGGVIAPITPARPPAPPVVTVRPVDSLQSVIDAGLKSAKHRTRKLAEKVRADAAELRSTVNAEREEREAAEKKAAEEALLRLEVDQLEKELAEKRAKLGQTKPLRSRDSGGQSKAIRAWAAEQGIAVGASGRISAELRAAYHKAHEAADA